MQPAEVEQVLAACGSHVNEERRAAEATAMGMIKKKECVPLLIAQLTHSQQPGVRQLASILLRKKIIGHWKNLGLDLRVQLKGTLLQCVLQEPIKVVRLGIAHCIAMLAKAEMSAGTWPELFAFLMTNSQSAVATHRELVIILLHACSETISATAGAQTQAISTFLLQGLSDSEESIRVQTLRTASAFLMTLEDSSVIIKLLPAMFTVLEASLQSEDEELFLTAFELIEDLLDTASFKGKADSLLQIIKFCLGVGGTATCNLKYREKACEILGKVANTKPKLLIKHNVVEPICRVAIAMLSDKACQTVSLEPEDDVLSHVAIGTQLVDALSCGLPTSVFGTMMLTWVKNDVMAKDGTPEADPFLKKAAVMAVSAMSLGCRDLLRKEIELVVAVTKSCVSDPNPMVREAALVASSLLTDYLQPEILDYHNVLLPLGIDLLSDANPYVREKAATMVDTFAENLGDDALPYAEPLMVKLAAIISTDAGPEGMRARCVAVSAISSLAQAIHTNFTPYASQTFSMLIPLLRVSEDELLTLRARATDTIGVVASAVGKEVFNPHLQEVMALVEQGLTLETPEINEYSFGFWSNVAEMYPLEMEQHLGVTVPKLFTVIDAKEGEISSAHPFGDLPSTNMGTEEDSDDEDTEDFSEGDMMQRLHVDSKVVLAISAALHCLGIFAKTCGAGFEPYKTEAALKAMENSKHHNSTVRKNALTLLTYLAEWDFKKNYVVRVVGMPDADTLATSTREALDVALMGALDAMRTDDDREVVAQAMDGVGHICEVFGAVAIHNHIDALLDEIKTLMQHKANCQLVQESDDEDQDDELPEDHDQSILIDAVFDCVDKMAKAYGSSFIPMFNKLLPFIEKYLHPDRPSSDHCMAIATYGESAEAFGSSITPHVDRFLQACVLGFKSEDPGVRSNACYTAGVTCKSAGTQVSSKIPSLLPLIGAVMLNPSESKGGIDNAVSAVCRLIQVDPAVCHLNQTLPPMLKCIPLRTDFGENENVYRTIKHLLATQQQVMQPLIPDVVAALAKALVLPSTQDGVKIEINQMLQGLASVPGGEAAIRGLPQDLKAHLPQPLQQ